ncbi:MAG: hypothetical protein EOP84_33750 [Verrucomicrobiaceae bacterium]|nr:MAG: hypothetical protein EOP84_33750 [Verrucomicrobiaceae bacterium]
MPALRPILRWAGSKKKLLPQLENLTPKTFTRYIEPFAGSASLFFRLNPEQAILSGLNGELINCYRQIVRSPVKLANQLAALPRNREYYNHKRSIHPSSLE